MPANGAGGPSPPPIAVGERLALDPRRRAHAALCVEHCVRLDGVGTFVSGWLFDPLGGVTAARIERPAGEPHPLAVELARPEIVMVEKRALRRRARRSCDGLRPGFWELVPHRDDGGSQLRLACELRAGSTRAFAVESRAEVKRIVEFLQASGLYLVSRHLPAESASLPAAWRQALLRLSWLVPDGSLEALQLAAYLDGGQPLSPAALSTSIDSSRPERALPPPETVRAIRESDLFDERYYRATYPEVATAGTDPLTHYLTLGHREGRDPSPVFKTTYYRAKYLAGDPRSNPLVHYHETGADRGFHPQPGPHDFEEDVYAQIRHWSAPGDAAEEFDPAIAAGRVPTAKAFAFYLPQFHAIPENDRWWGPGFTEWRNLMRAMPRFAGHYQPRIPRDLGFYDLTGADVMARQAELARAAGLQGFRFYYYRFNDRRVLDRPIEGFLSDPSLDLPFCLIWANENWTRRWDGAEHQILMRQEYDSKHDQGLIDDLQRHFADPRYLRLEGRPLLLIYRFDIIPSPRRTLEHWRSIWRQRHGEEPLIFLAQTFDALDPRDYGADGAVEFPPHKVARYLPPVNQSARILDPGFTGHIYDYDTIASSAEREPYPDFPLVKGVVPSWDNDARRQGAGVALRGSSPRRYEQWLRAAVGVAERNPVHGERLVFVNAWNEWAEGAYLEPDVHYGAAYLNATARALCGQRPGREPGAGG